MDIPLLNKKKFGEQGELEQRDYIKHNGGIYRGKGVWHTYKSNERLKEIM